MRRSVAFVVPLLVLAGAAVAPGLWAQETDLSANGLFAKALENMNTQEGFHVKMGAEVSLGQGMAPMTIESEGWVRNPDLAFYKMKAMGGMETETYRKGKVSVRRDATGQWQIEDEQGGLGNQKLSNPREYLDEFRKYSDKAVYLENEKLGTLDCRVIKADPPAEAIRGFIGGIGIPDAAIDWNKAKLTFRVWISKDDILVRQVIADLEVELSGFGGGLDEPGFEEDPPGGADAKGGEKKGGDHPQGDGKIGSDAKGEHPKGGDAKKGEEGKKDPSEDLGFEGDDEFSQPMKLTPKAKFEIFDYNKDVGLDKVPEEVRKKLDIK